MVVQLDMKKAFDRCMKARLGTVSSSKVRMSRGLPQGAPESLVIFTMITELVLRDFFKNLITRKLAWRLDDFVLGAICYANDVVLVAASVAAAEVMVAEVIAKLKDVSLNVGAQKKTLEHHGGRTGCVEGGSLGVCGIEGVSGRECKTCDRAQNS